MSGLSLMEFTYGIHTLNRQQIREWQILLVCMGAKLAIDGFWGKNTAFWTKIFQKQAGLLETGELDRETLISATVVLTTEGKEWQQLEFATDAEQKSRIGLIFDSASQTAMDIGT